MCFSPAPLNPFLVIACLPLNISKEEEDDFRLASRLAMQSVEGLFNCRTH